MLRHKYTRLIIIILTAISFLWLGRAFANTTDNIQLQSLRETFKSAESALRKGQWTRYKQHKARLSSYPLLVYLEYEELAKTGSKPEATQEFINSYPHFPHNRPLYNRLLIYYYKNKDWQAAIEAKAELYDPCLYLLALHNLKRDKAKILSDLKEYWLNGRYFNEKCNALITGLRLRLYQNDRLVWHRIAGALEKNNWRTIREINKHIDSDDRKAYNALLKLRRNKRSIAREVHNLRNDRPGRVVLTYVLSSYPSDHIEEAYGFYRKKVKNKFRLDEGQKKSVEYNLGLFMTIENLEQGFNLMRGLDPSLLEDEEHEWRARSAIKFGKWNELIGFIEDFPAGLQKESSWLYWMGYALMKTNNRGKARDFFKEASQNRDFYGFLAAERARTDKSFNHTPAKYERGNSALNLPSFKRFFELTSIDRDRQAIREWEATLRQANQEELLFLASAAYSKDWHYHAIRAFAVASYWDDLHRRFPTPYTEEVSQAADKNLLPESLVYAIMRTESSFRPDIASSAGAIGLMQVLPSTGRTLIRETRYRGSRSLINPRTSIDIGAAYLKKLLDKYEGNLILAIASYNAGPNAVREWLPKRGRIPPEEWIETVPYGETRKYLRSIFYAKVIFEWRLGNKDLSLQRNLQSIKHSY